MVELLYTHWAVFPNLVPDNVWWPVTSVPTESFCTSAVAAMPTLALHTLGSRRARYMTVTSRQTPQTDGSAYPHIHPCERLPDAVRGHKTRLRRSTLHSDRVVHRTSPLDRPTVRGTPRTYGSSP